jgi:hypothetical protein
MVVDGILPTPVALTAVDHEGPSVNEIILAFLRHASDLYRRADGAQTGELENIRLALRPLKSLYGGTPARDFGPKALKSVRQGMINSGLCRRTINQRIGRSTRIFRFAIENELVPTSIHHGLKARWIVHPGFCKFPAAPGGNSA